MARAALKLSTQKLAEMASVGVNTINRFEDGQDARLSSVDKMKRALESAGIIFLADGQSIDGGPGVRLARKP
jgi:predicted transcriptional regulator